MFCKIHKGYFVEILVLNASIIALLYKVNKASELYLYNKNDNNNYARIVKVMNNNHKNNM